MTHPLALRGPRALEHQRRNRIRVKEELSARAQRRKAPGLNLLSKP
jgi:hypothetical protein